MAFGNGMANKGSQLWIQLYANNKYLFKELNHNFFIKEFGDHKFIVDAREDNLTWISPIKHDYDEYMLNANNFWNYVKKEKIDLPFIQEEIKKYWVSNHPKWDGIAINETEHILYLIEAKAHIEEITQDDKIIPIRNQNIINKIITNKDFITSIKYANWINKDCPKKSDYFDCTNCVKENPPEIFKNCKNNYFSHYQIINRLWMFDVIRYLIKKNNSEWKVKLVFIDFINDHTSDKNNKITYCEFENAYNHIYDKLDKNLKDIDGVSLIYFCVDKISSAYKTKIIPEIEALNTKFW